MSKSPELLATEYLILTDGQTIGELTDNEYIKHWPKLRELVTACGNDSELAGKHIKQAKEVHKMIHG